MIPKPRKFLKRYSGCTTFKELRSHCKWTNEKFNKVKETVRCVKKRHLNYGEGGNIILEDHVKRKNIENEVLPLLPELDGFQDVWMLYAILERIAAIERDIVMPSKLKLRHKHTRCGNKKKTKFLTSVNKCTKTSDKPDTKISKALEAPLSEPNSSASELTSSTNQARQTTTHVHTVFSGSPVSMPPVTSEPNLEQTPVIALDDGLGVIECPRLVARQPKFRPAPRHDKTDEPGPIRIGYAACLFCQYVPDIPSSAQTILQRDFGSQKGIIAALVGLGITNDRHLFILNKLRMWNLGLEPFLNSLLSKNEISLLQKLSLLASFKRQSELNTESDLEPSDSIPSSLLNDASWYSYSGCPFHSISPSDPHLTSPKLHSLLTQVSMQELMPLFIKAGVTNDHEFEMLQCLDEWNRVLLFDEEVFKHVRPFQRWMLTFVSSHVDWID